MDWNFGIYNPRKINANFQVPKEGLHRFILHRELQIRINWIRIQIRVQIPILSKYKKNMKLTSKPAFFYFNVCKKVLMFNDLCYNFDDSFLSKSGSGKCILILYMHWLLCTVHYNMLLSSFSNVLYTKILFSI